MNTLIYNYFMFDLISWLEDFNINSFWISRNIAKIFNTFLVIKSHLMKVFGSHRIEKLVIWFFKDRKIWVVVTVTLIQGLLVFRRIMLATWIQFCPQRSLRRANKITNPSLPEKAMAPRSSTLAWKIPWTEEPGRLQSMGSWRVGHDWVTSLSLFIFMHWRRQCTPVFLPGESQGRGSLVGCRLWDCTESDVTEVT